MAKLKRRWISRSAVDAMKVDRDTVFWDRDQPGFGVRVYASGTKMYIAQARHGGESIRVTLGRHGVITADEARSRASTVLNRIRAGEEAIDAPLPARTGDGTTMADLAERYMEQHVSAHCRDSTVVSIRKLLDRYVLPEFGGVQLMAMKRDRVAAFHVRRSGTPSAANQTVALIARMYRKAADWGMVPDGTNPCRGIGKHREGKRERFLTDTEFRRLGEVLAEAEVKGGASVHAVAAIRLLMLTGCRRNEILTMKWEMVNLDIGELRLPDTIYDPPRFARTIVDPEGTGCCHISDLLTGLSMPLALMECAPACPYQNVDLYTAHRKVFHGLGPGICQVLTPAICLFRHHDQLLSSNPGG